MRRTKPLILVAFVASSALSVNASAAATKTTVTSHSKTVAGITLTTTAPLAGPAIAPPLVPSSGTESSDSRLVRAAKSALATRSGGRKSRIVIDSSTLLVSGTRSVASPMPGAPLPSDLTVRSYPTSNQSDPNALARSAAVRRVEAERARVDKLRREQVYRSVQNDDYTPNDGEEDQIERRLTVIPTEIARPPL